MNPAELLLSADDRTGALEVGGLVAADGAPVPVGPDADHPRCCVVDIATRHLGADAARLRMRELVARPARLRAHKMDAGLRGNWPVEIEVLLEAGYPVTVLCSFPDAGRRCLDGVVYIHDRPVLESVFGADPLNAPVSSRPAEVLEHWGVRGDVEVCDANDNVQLRAGVDRALAEGRVVVGASGALGMVAAAVFGTSLPARVPLPRPTLVLCGSLNPLSRQQIAALGIDASMDPTFRDGLALVCSEVPAGDISDEDAAAMSLRLAAVAHDRLEAVQTVIIVGGDTAGAVFGSDTVEALGMVAPGVPACRYRGRTVVTKGGGIGQPDTLRQLTGLLD